MLKRVYHDGRCQVVKTVWRDDEEVTMKHAVGFLVALSVARLARSWIIS